METPTKGLPALVRKLAESAPDDAARHLRKLPKRKRAAVAATLAQKRREEVLALASHEPGTAGALMTSRYADLPAGIAAREAVRRLAAEAETIYNAYVVDERRLLGVVGLRDLLTSEREATVGDVMVDAPDKARLEESDEAAARRLLAAPYLALPVVDDGNRLLGIVTYDDAHRRLGKTATSTMRFPAKRRRPDISRSPPGPRSAGGFPGSWPWPWSACWPATSCTATRPPSTPW